MASKICTDIEHEIASTDKFSIKSKTKLVCFCPIGEPSGGLSTQNALALVKAVKPCSPQKFLERRASRH
jgi:hypothetical protein